MKKVIWSFNTQPPEGGWAVLKAVLEMDVVSTHSRPKAAGFRHSIAFDFPCMFQHTAARRRLVSGVFEPAERGGFQHTAARRRLGAISCSLA